MAALNTVTIAMMAKIRAQTLLLAHNPPNTTGVMVSLPYFLSSVTVHCDEQLVCAISLPTFLTSIKVKIDLLKIIKIHQVYKNRPGRVFLRK